MSKSKITCGITMGDPAGIGPEVILKTLRYKKIQRLANFVVIGNSFVFKKTADLLKIKLNLSRIEKKDSYFSTEYKNISIFNIGDVSKLSFGRCIPAYGLLALNSIKASLKLIKSKHIDVLTTAPVNKHTINRAGCFFTGHTEYLAQASQTKDFVMMLVGGQLKVALVTRHLPLKDVAAALTKEKICKTIKLTAKALRKDFGIADPRIGVCGLNPHSGEKGILGQEEIKIIQPAVRRAKHCAYVEGPLPADTLFYSVWHGKFDAAVAMYHDQGLIPLKMLALHQGVNLTLGLPFIRTSVDHGTAYDIAGKNKADPGSMIEAIKLAVKIGSRKQD